MNRSAVFPALAAGSERPPILDESRGRVLSREEAATATETVAALGAVSIAVPVPSTARAFRAYVREGAYMVCVTSAERRDVHAGIEAPHRLAREIDARQGAGPAPEIGGEAV